MYRLKEGNTNRGDPTMKKKTRRPLLSSCVWVKFYPALTRAYQKNVSWVYDGNWVPPPKLLTYLLNGQKVMTETGYPHQNYLLTCSTDKKCGMNMSKSVNMYRDMWSNGEAQGPII